MSAQERTQGIEKRKFADMESKVGLAKPVGPLQGMPRKKVQGVRLAQKTKAAPGSAVKSAAASKVAKATLTAPSRLQKKLSSAAAPSQILSCVQMLGQAAKSVTTHAKQGVACSNSVSLFALAKGPGLARGVAGPVGVA